MPKPKFILLDLDGTLIRGGNRLPFLHFIARALPRIKHFSESLSTPLGWQETWGLIKNVKRAMDHFHPVQTNYQRIIAVFEQALNLPNQQASEFVDRLFFDVFQNLKPHFSPMPGANAFLKWAKQEGYPLILATNPIWKREVVEMRMKWGEIDPEFFEWITTADELHACKPHLQYFEEVFKKIDADPRECFFVGNEIKMDLPVTHLGTETYLINPNMREPRIIQHNARMGNFISLQNRLMELA